VIIDPSALAPARAARPAPLLAELQASHPPRRLHVILHSPTASEVIHSPRGAASSVRRLGDRPEPPHQGERRVHGDQAERQLDTALNVSE